jgi:hypothetical protein
MSESPDGHVTLARQPNKSATQRLLNLRVENFPRRERGHENGLLRRNDGDAASHIDEDDHNAFTEWRSAMHVCSRRQALSILAGTSVAAHGKISVAAPAQQGLGAIAAKNGFVFGAAAGPVIDKDLA